MSRWVQHASRWHLQGPPLRPSAADLTVVQRVADEWRRVHKREPRVLVLGVTPELVNLFSQVTAVDNEPAMIQALFKPRPGHRVVEGNWLTLPLEDASVDLVVGDGSTNQLSFPEGYRALALGLQRVLAPGGRVALRLFAAPEVQETLDDVAAALDAGIIGSMFVLKWRVAMALPTPKDTWRLRSTDILDAFNQLVPDRAALAARTGWPLDVIENIDIYKNDVDGTHAFPPLSAVRDVFASQFQVQATVMKPYEIGDRCPTIVLAPLPRPSDNMTFPRTCVPGIGLPAIPDRTTSSILAMLWQLDRSQWWTPDVLAQHQRVQLNGLLMHAAATVPHYKKIDPKNWSSVPIIPRTAIRKADLRSTAYLSSHGATEPVKTRGDRADNILGNAVIGLLWHAFKLRDHTWHQRDWSAKTCVIRNVIDQSQPPNTGIRTAEDITGSPMAILPLTAHVEQQIAWIQRERPEYLLTYPTVLHALLKRLGAQRFPFLKQIRTISEQLKPETRAL